MKRKGFTLIELLAVIVILAIIALIAVPVIMNIISSARESAFEDTAYGLISAGEMYYTRELLNNGMTSDVEFTIEDGEFVGENKLEVKGALPQTGKIKVTVEGKVALAITNGSICITKGYDDSKIDPEADLDNCELPAEPAKTLSELAKTNDFATSVDGCVISGICEVGTKFAIEVVPGNIQNFYVINDTNNTVTLIMDRNIDEETVAWNTSGNNIDGPITALDYLESKTSSWINIEEKTYTITDDKGENAVLRKNARTRMITYVEINDLINSHSWLYGDYWTSSISVDYDYSAAWGVFNEGFIEPFSADASDYFGVRPVIEIKK